MLKFNKNNNILVALTLLLLLYPISALSRQTINLYRSKVHTFSIVFPDGWQQRMGQSPHTVVVSENSEKASVIIQVFQRPYEVSLDDVSDEILRGLINDSFAYLKKNMFPDAVMEKSGTTYIANKKAFWMLYTYSIKGVFFTEKFVTKLYSVFHENKNYQILCSSPKSRYDYFNKTLSNTVNSLVFEDSAVSEPAREKPSGPRWRYPQNPKWEFGAGEGNSPSEMPTPLNR